MNKKRRLHLVVVLVCTLIVSSLLITACTPETPAPAPTPPPPPTPSPEPEEKWVPPIPGMKQGEEDLYFNWQFNSPFPEHAIPEFFSSHEWYPQQMYERTGGRMNMEVVYGGALGPAGESMELMGANMFQMGMESASFYPNLVYSAFGTTPGLCKDNTDVVTFSKIKNFIWMHPLSQKETEELYNCTPVLGNCAAPFILLSNKKIEKPEDMEGLQVRGSGVYSLFFEQFGAVPIAFPTPETYEWFQRGMVDMVTFSISEIPARKMWEVVDYAVDIGWIAGGGGVYANKDEWAALPQYIRDISDQLVAEYPDQFVKDFGPGFEEAKRVVFEESGIEIIEPSPEVLAAWRDAESKIVDLWVAAAEEKGLQDARSFADGVLAFVAALDKDPTLQWSRDAY